MFDLFGSEMPLPAKFFIAFATVLALIGLTAWLVRRFGANRLGGGNNRGRQPRLAVIDAATVDGRRRLVLIRRDNVEHLLMIGGPTDLVVEPNIVRAAAARDATREPSRGEMARTEPALRPPPPVENTWPLQPVSESPPAQRSFRASATEEPWLPPEPGARPRPSDSGSLTGLAAELSTRLTPPEPAAPVPRSEPPVRAEPQMRSEPQMRAAPPVSAPAAAPVAAAAVAATMAAPEVEAPAGPPQTDHNLAEMAQQLEAALRRTSMPDGRPPVTDPLAVPTAMPKQTDNKQTDKPAAKSADAPPRPPARDYKLRADPQFEQRAEPKFDAKPETKPEPAFETNPKPATPGGKTVYDSLEEEMASLLGRPPGKT